jgi:choline dehydrogenase-like flavoprotein
MDVSYIPAAIRDGARVLTSVRAERVLATDGPGRTRAEAVVGRVVAPFTGRPGPRFRVNARHVVLAAGCVATPVILLKSGFANGSGQVGRNLQFHPGVAITGIFPEPTHPEFGATQGYQSLQFVEEGFKLETLWAPPGVLAVRTPGFGHELKARLAEIPRSATWDAIASCHRSLGRVVPRRFSMDPVLHYRMDAEDVGILQDALWRLAEIFFAAGAEKIMPGVHGLPEEMNSREEAEAIRRHPLRATDVVAGGNHVFCTTRMHGDPRKGVVDEDGRCHDLENLWIADTGIFARCTSVNPMLTGMALAHRQAQVLADRLP